MCGTDHWFTIRKVHGVWWDLNSLLKRPAVRFCWGFDHGMLDRRITTVVL